MDHWEEIIMDTRVETAADRTVCLSDGTERNLSEFWKNGFLILVFLRHFG